MVVGMGGVHRMMIVDLEESGYDRYVYASGGRVEPEKREIRGIGLVEARKARCLLSLRGGSKE